MLPCVTAGAAWPREKPGGGGGGRDRREGRLGEGVGVGSGGAGRGQGSLGVPQGLDGEPCSAAQAAALGLCVVCRRLRGENVRELSLGLVFLVCLGFFFLGRRGLVELREGTCQRAGAATFSYCSSRYLCYVSICCEQIIES